jgi:hypothetical protein
MAISTVIPVTPAVVVPLPTVEVKKDPLPPKPIVPVTTVVKKTLPPPLPPVPRITRTSVGQLPRYQSPYAPSPPVWKTTPFPEAILEVNPRFKEFLSKRRKQYCRIVFNFDEIPLKQQWKCNKLVWSSWESWELSTEQKKELGPWNQVVVGLSTGSFMSPSKFSQGFRIFMYGDYVFHHDFTNDIIDGMFTDPRDTVSVAILIYQAFERFLIEEPVLL